MDLAFLSWVPCTLVVYAGCMVLLTTPKKSTAMNSFWKPIPGFLARKESRLLCQNNLLPVSCVVVKQIKAAFTSVPNHRKAKRLQNCTLFTIFSMGFLCFLMIPKCPPPQVPPQQPSQCSVWQHHQQVYFPAFPRISTAAFSLSCMVAPSTFSVSATSFFILSLKSSSILSVLCFSQHSHEFPHQPFHCDV